MRSRLSADALTASGTPANSRPTRMISPSRKAKSHNGVSPLVVNRHEAAPAGGSPSREGGPRIVDLDRQGLEIIHSGAPEAAVADSKSSRFDDRRFDPEAGAGAHYRAGVLRDIGLKQGKQEGGGRRVHSTPPLPARRPKRKRSVVRMTRAFACQTPNSRDAPAYGHPIRSMRKTASNVGLRRCAAIDEDAGKVRFAKWGRCRKGSPKFERSPRAPRRGERWGFN